ncbi:MAG: hypothetical protein GC184_06525 [Rhizobiales bacterium]|nr:hypothetical protein [Hyphomicrobiales bacterium]
MSRDGFASLTAGLLVRRQPINEMPEMRRAEPQPRLQPAPEVRAEATLRDIRQPEPPALEPHAREPYAPEPVLRSTPQPSPGPVPEEDRVYYQGPERRARDVSPLVERRRSVPPRVKVSVRLEQHRYVRLRMASEDSGRTHQDLMTTALDHYLDMLRVPRMTPRRRV